MGQKKVRLLAYTRRKMSINPKLDRLRKQNIGIATNNIYSAHTFRQDDLTINKTFEQSSKK